MTRELTTDLSMLERLIKPYGNEILDVGCGSGALVRALSAGGARVVGVEISERQLADAIARDSGSGARYLVGCAQILPLDDACADVVVFMRSLHHVPSEDLVPALREARRVLRPGGAVVVVEPLAQGDYYVLTSLIDDELEARTATQLALAQAALAGLERSVTIDYDVRLCIADLRALRARVVSVDPNRAELFGSRRAEIEEAFQRLGEPGEQPGERCFVQTMRADVLRPAAA